MHIPVTHYFNWWRLHHAMFESACAELAENGIHRLCFPNTHVLDYIEDHSFAPFIHELSDKYGLVYDCVHSHWGAEWDLNAIDESTYAIRMKNQKIAVDLAQEFGAPIVMIHPGYSALDQNPLTDLNAMHEACYKFLDELLPYAEKAGVSIALENNIAPIDTVGQIRHVLTHYGQTPLLGCCYDSGHAWEMTYSPDKDPKLIGGKFVAHLWNENTQLYPTDGLEELLPWITCCHLHDNDGTDDSHRLPGENGTINWKRLIGLLDKAPRLQCVMNESGAPGTTIKRMARVFHELWEERTSPLLK